MFREWGGFAESCSRPGQGGHRPLKGRPERSGVRIRAGPPQAKGLPHKLPEQVD
jgi:hypothetical protein